MYKVIFKGRDIEPIFVEDAKGATLWDAWVGEKKARVVVNNTAFYTGDIKQIIKVEKTQAEVAPKQDKAEYEYLTYRKKMLSLPIEKRASILRIPKLIWASNTKQEMTDELKEQIKERQLAYFTENPNCIYANPKVYRDLIVKHIPLGQIENSKPIQNILPTATLRIVEELIRTDLQYSKKTCA